jgi:hypothetical protein
MSGRRSHARFAVLQSPEGVLRVVRDIMVESSTPDYIVAVSSEPGVLGEVVFVEFPAQATAVRARVLESQPIVVDGAVRHQLRLLDIDAQASRCEAGE